MDNQIIAVTLEDILVLSLTEFARKHNRFCETRTSQSDTPDRRKLYLELLEFEDNYGGYLRNVFGHSVILKNGQTIVNEKTEKVGEKKSHRNLYVEFLGLVNSRGIKLNNHFESIWASNPEKYPISNSDENK